MNIPEREALSVNGFVAVIIALILVVFALGCFASRVPQLIAAGIVPLFIAVIIPFGLIILQPNQARVLTFFGRYVGSVRRAGFHCVNPFTSKREVSLRVHNFQADKLKVNDARGNPIEIAAVVVWRVRDAMKAVFDVENYGQFVGIQGETAIRSLASHFSYDSHDGEPSLRGSPEVVGEALKKEVQERLDVAGLEVLEARISHLAYAPEIAQAMLRVQQAEAVIIARQKIVEGAVGMVELALKRLSDKAVVHLDDERKATMVNNLLVALVSETSAQPVINTGTMYQ